MGKKNNPNVLLLCLLWLIILAVLTLLFLIRVPSSWLYLVLLSGISLVGFWFMRKYYKPAFMVYAGQYVSLIILIILLFTYLIYSNMT